MDDDVVVERISQPSRFENITLPRANTHVVVELMTQNDHTLSQPRDLHANVEVDSSQELNAGHGLLEARGKAGRIAQV